MTVGILVSAAFRIMVVSRLPEDAFLFAGLAGILVISVASAALGEEFTAVLFYVLGAIALARASVIVPASKRRRRHAQSRALRYPQRRRKLQNPTAVSVVSSRSEERRVGKECGSKCRSR